MRTAISTMSEGRTHVCNGYEPTRSTASGARHVKFIFGPQRRRQRSGLCDAVRGRECDDASHDSCASGSARTSSRRSRSALAGQLLPSDGFSSRSSSPTCNRKELDRANADASQLVEKGFAGECELAATIASPPLPPSAACVHTAYMLVAEGFGHALETPWHCSTRTRAGGRLPRDRTPRIFQSRLTNQSPKSR